VHSLLWTLIVHLLLTGSCISLFGRSCGGVQVGLAFSDLGSPGADLRTKAHSLSRLSSCLALLLFKYFPLFLDFFLNLLFVAEIVLFLLLLRFFLLPLLCRHLLMQFFCVAHLLRILFSCLFKSQGFVESSDLGVDRLVGEVVASELD
jgi:hypothetical protein